MVDKHIENFYKVVIEEKKRIEKEEYNKKFWESVIEKRIKKGIKISQFIEKIREMYTLDKSKKKEN